MREKLCSLTIILAMVLQIFVSALPGEVSTFKAKGSHHQTFIDSATNPFIATISSQRAKQIRCLLDSLPMNVVSYVHVWVSDRIHFTIENTSDYVRSQINLPLLI